MNNPGEKSTDSKRKPRLVVLTGAGMSAESGIPTFRDAGGLWEGHRVEDVATPEGWARNRSLVLDFYNQRRRRMWECKPNAGHLGLVALEEQFDVSIITQNVDNLHEQAGSHHVLHLHGELSKARSTLDPALVIEIGERDICVGDKCPRGSQLRPHIVWFGENVPMLGEAQEIAATADIFVIIGTSLAVYPAAGLVDFAPAKAPIYLIDPATTMSDPNVIHLKAGASEGVCRLAEMLKSA